ncbi:hypothetical protein CMI47_14500 [Candidatus Pacearchaeota archaeon]|nr:hypothetical protein [Candidatus Pacearchaeota archaeon]
MNIGDIVRCKPNGSTILGGEIGIVMTELRHGVNASFVDVLVNGEIISFNWKGLEVINGNR